MKKIQFKYQFVVFLHAYFRQMDLSLDRSRWGPWGDLKEYYKHQISPLKVAEVLKNYSKLDLKEDKKFSFLTFRYPSFQETLHSFFLRIVYNRYYMTTKEISYSYQLLLKFNDMLSYNLDGYIFESDRGKIDFSKFYIELLRQKVVFIYAYTLEQRLLPKDSHRAMSIEHFFQNENITTKPITEFLNGFSL